MPQRRQHIDLHIPQAGPDSNSLPSLPFPQQHHTLHMCAFNKLSVMTKVMMLPPVITEVKRTLSHQKNWSESTHFLSRTSFSSLYNGNNRIYKILFIHLINSYWALAMSGAMLGAGNTAMNMMTLTSWSSQSQEILWDSWKSFTTCKGYTIMKHCSFSMFPNLVNDITVCLAVQVVNLGIILHSSLAFILPTIPINHQTPSDSPAEKSLTCITFCPGSHASTQGPLFPCE